MILLEVWWWFLLLLLSSCYTCCYFGDVANVAIIVGATVFVRRNVLVAMLIVVGFCISCYLASMFTSESVDADSTYTGS